jgi:hypothetical protein
MGTTLARNTYLYLEISDITCGFKLGNDEAFYLYDTQGNLVDFYDWDATQTTVDTTLSRKPNGMGDFQDATPTPRRSN